MSSNSKATVRVVIRAESPRGERTAAGWESRRSRGLGGGRAGGPTAWLLKRGRGASSGLWGYRGSCRQVEQVAYGAHASPKSLPKAAGCRAGPGVRLLACIPGLQP